MEIEISGQTYSVERILTRNRNAIASLKDRTIVISLPSKWSRKDKDEIFDNLLKRSIRSIAKGRWTVEGSRKLVFSHGQMLCAMGRTFHVSYRPGEMLRSRLNGSTVEVEMPDSDEGKASEHVKRHLVMALMPQVRERVEYFNKNHFKANIDRINIRDNLTLWGSCSYNNRTIGLNFRLLFMPGPVRDYVIVHELAHTSYKSHGPRFWGLVGKVLPGFEEHREWLRKNGWSVFSNQKKTGQLSMADFMPIDEKSGPY